LKSSFVQDCVIDRVYGITGQQLIQLISDQLLAYKRLIELKCWILSCY